MVEGAYLKVNTLCVDWTMSHVSKWQSEFHILGLVKPDSWERPRLDWTSYLGLVLFVHEMARCWCCEKIYCEARQVGRVRREATHQIPNLYADDINYSCSSLTGEMKNKLGHKDSPTGSQKTFLLACSLPPTSFFWTFFLTSWGQHLFMQSILEFLATKTCWPHKTVAMLPSLCRKPRKEFECVFVGVRLWDFFKFSLTKQF